MFLIKKLNKLVLYYSFWNNSVRKLLILNNFYEYMTFERFPEHPYREVLYDGQYGAFEVAAIENSAISVDSIVVNESRIPTTPLKEDILALQHGSNYHHMRLEAQLRHLIASSHLDGKARKNKATERYKNAWDYINLLEGLAKDPDPELVNSLKFSISLTLLRVMPKYQANPYLRLFPLEFRPTTESDMYH